MRNCLVVGAKRYTDIKSFTYIQVPEDERNSIMLGLEDMQWDKKDLVMEKRKSQPGFIGDVPVFALTQDWTLEFNLLKQPAKATFRCMHCLRLVTIVLVLIRMTTRQALI